MSESQITYRLIQDLLTEEVVERTTLKCVFVCPVSGQRVPAQADVLKANEGSVLTKAKHRLRESMARSMTRSVSQALRSVLGNNAVGRIAGDVGKDAATRAASGHAFSADELENAAVAAFEAKARSQFVWDEALGGFRHVRAVTSAGA